MLALKLGLSLNNIKHLGGAWSPSDEANLEAWYPKGVGIVLNGSDVSEWRDQSGNGVNMSQSTASQQPAYSSGVLTFDGTDDCLVSSTGQITLTGDFVVGVKLTVNTVPGGTILGDFDASGEWMRFISSTVLRIKANNTTVINLNIDSGSIATTTRLVLTRNSGTVSFWWNGVLQADTETLTDTVLTDAIGIRKGNLQPWDGTMEEIQIYSSYSSDLVANVDAYLAAL
mgnify:CR=1 FL=1|tara:strand:- start:1318 stop:2001 length:684 start_codon:yes stop_codon:yes gene_type:complete